MVSTNFRESAFSPETADVWLVLASISHSELVEDHHIVNNNEDITSGGTLYSACPFKIVLPDDTTDGAPVARFQIDDVHKELGAALREISSAATIRLRVVLASDPDTVEEDFGDMELQDARVTLTSVTGRIGVENINQEPFPAEGFSPSYFAGLYQ